jgi:hypothetical protein
MGHRKNLRLCNFTLKALEANVTAAESIALIERLRRLFTALGDDVTYIRLSEERSKAS